MLELSLLQRAVNGGDGRSPVTTTTSTSTSTPALDTSAFQDAMEVGSSPLMLFAVVCTVQPHNLFPCTVQVLAPLLPDTVSSRESLAHYFSGAQCDPVSVIESASSNHDETVALLGTLILLATSIVPQTRLCQDNKDRALGLLASLAVTSQPIREYLSVHLIDMFFNKFNKSARTQGFNPLLEALLGCDKFVHQLLVKPQGRGIINDLLPHQVGLFVTTLQSLMSPPINVRFEETHVPVLVGLFQRLKQEDVRATHAAVAYSLVTRSLNSPNRSRLYESEPLRELTRLRIINTGY